MLKSKKSAIKILRFSNLKQAEKLKSREMKEGWMKNVKDEWRMMLKVEWWKMMISSCWGVSVTDRQMSERTDICECRVAFATEKV